MKKVTPISFKKALVLVVALHIFGFVAIYSYSKVNSYFARKERESYREQIYSNYSTRNEWPIASSKLRILAIPPQDEFGPIKGSAEVYVKKIKDLQDRETLYKQKINDLNTQVEALKNIIIISKS
jgi:hypothetical protein